MKNQTSLNKVAFIIGNGTSRQQFDLNNLRGQGKIFGCNALYRDFEPDFLVAIDDKIIKEIKESDFPDWKFIEPPEEEKYEPREYHPNYVTRSNAGMNAMLEAIKRKYTELYCFGFDFLIDDKEQSTSNVYDGTNAYGPETRCSYHDNDGRISYLEWFCKKYSDVNFTFAFPKDTSLKPIRGNNIFSINYDS